MVPKTMNVHAVPKGVVLQVRNVLTNLVDIAGRPRPAARPAARKATDPAERRSWRDQDVLRRRGPIAAAHGDRRGGYDVLQLLDEFPSCSLNIFEFLQVAQPLRPALLLDELVSPRIHGDGVAHLPSARGTPYRACRARASAA